MMTLLRAERASLIEVLPLRKATDIVVCSPLGLGVYM